MRSYLLFLLIILAACAPATTRLDRLKLSNSQLVSDLTPDKGEGASYRLNEQIKFSFKLAKAAFITLLSYDADGTSSPAEINLQLSSGIKELPRFDDRIGTTTAAYLVGKPFGTTRVILIATDTPLRGVFKGKFDGSQLENLISRALEASNIKAFDIAETQFEVKE